MLRWRFVTALILAPIILAAIMYGNWVVVAAVLLIVIARAAQELSRALDKLPFVAAFGAGALPLLLSLSYGTSGALAGVFLSLPWSLLWLSGYPEARTLRALLALLLMALWVGAPLAHLGLMQDLEPDGRYLVLVAVVGPWISDSGAYFAGRFFGRHALFPTLSPKKTVEGGFGGLLVTVAVVGYFTHTLLGFGVEEAVLWGAVISLLSQAGDLFESILKRLLELKDLGRALPGHGGILDRVDSLLFTAPAVYYLYVLSAA
ncbi:MAG: phosphatidate cytidylyltransferase [Actinomycetota bacterium]|nr:phosphatidate cytidylyltransferase [Actinomycetota bacterium]MDQ3842203.1 phosphatidate cytidylyltransferase [Actinomycetota bacterium]MDQ5814411.1 phosphatidate cytidylyltransferase [Actinomycetota bacterium]